MVTSTNRLKIGLVLDTSLDPNDGVQQYVINIGEWLRSKGHDVHYLVGQTENRDLQNVHSLSKNVSVKFNGNSTTIPLPTSKKKLVNFLNINKFDILHVQVPHSPFMAQKLIMAADKKTAVIGTFHILPYGFLSKYGNYALGIWLKPSLKRFDKMLAVSLSAAMFAKSSFNIDAKVLPNVVDFKNFYSAKPIKKYSDGKVNILFLGRLVPRKGCLTLLKAVNILDSDDSTSNKIRVIICGTGPLRTKLEKYVSDHKLNKIVEFKGYVDEVEKPSYYASSQISVFPSSAGESFGIVLLEAMAGGKAVVLAGDNPGYRSVMEPQESLLFNTNDIDKLASKIKFYIDNSNEKNRLAKWGLEYSRKFDIEKVGTQLLDVYDEALRKRRAL